MIMNEKGMQRLLSSLEQPQKCCAPRCQLFDNSLNSIASIRGKPNCLATDWQHKSRECCQDSVHFRLRFRRTSMTFFKSRTELNNFQYL